MNTSELTNKALVLRRLADQFDNIALRQISLDNESASLLSEFRELIPSRSQGFPQERPLNEAPRPGPAKRFRSPSTPGRSPGTLSDSNPTLLSILRTLQEDMGELCKETILARIQGPKCAVKDVKSLSFYLSIMKSRGLVNNPIRGFWRAAA